MGLPFLEPVSGGRGGGGDEEVVKNQAVISISYQVNHPFALFVEMSDLLFFIPGLE